MPTVSASENTAEHFRNMCLSQFAIHIDENFTDVDVCRDIYEAFAKIKERFPNMSVFNFNSITCTPDAIYEQLRGTPIVVKMNSEKTESNVPSNFHQIGVFNKPVGENGLFYRSNMVPYFPNKGASFYFRNGKRSLDMMQRKILVPSAIKNVKDIIYHAFFLTLRPLRVGMLPQGFIKWAEVSDAWRGWVMVDPMRAVFSGFAMRDVETSLAEAFVCEMNGVWNDEYFPDFMLKIYKDRLEKAESLEFTQSDLADFVNIAPHFIQFELGGDGEDAIPEDSGPVEVLFNGIDEVSGDAEGEGGSSDDEAPIPVGSSGSDYGEQ